MATLGHSAQGATKGTAVNADVKFALKVTASESGTITLMSCDLQNDGVDIVAFRVGVYNDAVTIANAILVDSSDVVLVAPGMVRQWVDFSGVNAPIIAGNSYWLTLQAGPTGGNASFWYDGGSGNELIANDVFSDGLSSSFGTPTSQPSNSIAIYATYTPSTVQVAGLHRVVFSRKGVMVG
jgi:hypothetical protein